MTRLWIFLEFHASHASVAQAKVTLLADEFRAKCMITASQLVIHFVNKQKLFYSYTFLATSMIKSSKLNPNLNKSNKSRSTNESVFDFLLSKSSSSRIIRLHFSQIM